MNLHLFAFIKDTNFFPELLQYIISILAHIFQTLSLKYACVNCLDVRVFQTLVGGWVIPALHDPLFIQLVVSEKILKMHLDRHVKYGLHKTNADLN